MRFPGLSVTVHLSFVSGTAPLAQISHRPHWPAYIQVNRALDRPDTPVHVFAHLLTHELIHLEVLPERRGRRIDAHPPRFWERQAELSPDQVRCEEWIAANVGHCLQTFGDGTWVCPTKLVRRRSAR